MTDSPGGRSALAGLKGSIIFSKKENIGLRSERLVALGNRHYTELTTGLLKLKPGFLLIRFLYLAVLSVTLLLKVSQAFAETVCLEQNRGWLQG